MPDYALMNQYLYEGKAKEVEKMTQDALAEGRHFQEVMNEGLIAGMSVVGEDFKHNVLYVPEVLIAARAMKAGMAVLKPLLSARENDANRVGVLLMGTVRGDLHDIGKNLVCMMAEGAGFEVYDIGVDQSVEKFMAAADKVNPKIIGMSALLTTTMTYMKTVIDGFEAAGRGEIKMAIGGAPISQMFADEIGADGYGQNASAAVDLFLRLASGKEADDEKSGPLAALGATKDSAEPAAVGKRSTYKILYWQEVPSQVRAEDDAGNDVSVELPSRFAQRIDSLAQKRGITGADAYTAEWKWSDEQERDGSAQDVVAAVIAELEAKADW
ncbi:MAG: cobalamin B12-binding domain protein [Gemmatimonadetes bacterium]|jgi:5-methyltetrahydrofolate--homocysteine methyltransferase|nr:cobalamin B12-binding domain protein [Gemmatimonadota bacterium]